ncbi:enoyl-CoA hydratase/isomerase family protein [Streptomyces cellulosae]|uniref:Enoyl-CoA hydratase/isomerase family protein n=1 Tax=Streptomyces cellulosae TaxID=1968 RepID=A0ABW7Y3E0_STRCE
MTTPPPLLRPDLSLKTLRVHRQDAVLSIELSTPEPGNVVTDTLLDDLWAVLAHQDPGIQVVVLSGAGDDFCLGGDRTEYAEHLLQDPSGGALRISGTKARRVCEALTDNPAVTVARVHGKVIGAGFALALACDLRVGSPDASFRLPELAFGLPMAWGGLLPRLLHEAGPARARELVLTGRAFDAQEALSLSILHKVVPAEDLDAAVTAWTKPLTRRPPAALRVTKTLLNSYTAATRLADPAALDPELMAAVVAETHRAAEAP